MLRNFKCVYVKLWLSETPTQHICICQPLQTIDGQFYLQNIAIILALTRRNVFKVKHYNSCWTFFNVFLVMNLERLAFNLAIFSEFVVVLYFSIRYNIIVFLSSLKYVSIYGNAATETATVSWSYRSLIRRNLWRGYKYFIVDCTYLF